MGQLPLEAADGMAKSTLSLLGLGDVDSSKLVQSLLELPEEDFFTKIPPGHPSMPTIDGDIISDLFTFQSFAGDLSVLPGKAWIDSILVASSKLDVSLPERCEILEGSLPRNNLTRLIGKHHGVWSSVSPAWYSRSFPS